jgi:hypothetical protein
MSSNIYLFLLFKSLYHPKVAFEELAKVDPSPLSILMRYSVWLLVLPPLFSLIGASNFDWRVGGQNPIMMSFDTLALVSLAYFFYFGLVSTSFISCWLPC